MAVITEPSAPVDPNELRALLRRHAASVWVITAPGNPPAGLTVTSVTSVSLRPPLVSFCVNRSSSSWPAFSVADYTAVHLLRHDQSEVAKTFATSGIDRFAAHTDWQHGPHGVPILNNTAAWLLCRITERVPAGDHSIVIAQPIATHSADNAPLLYYNGRFTVLPPAATEES
ncbi:MAG TPA: flavin reductase family protein [Micromonospora sp.]